MARLLFGWGLSTASDMNKWIDGEPSRAERKAFMH